jgi:ClpP class serine protease
MNYAHIFNRVYCTPLAISAEGFRSVDAVLRPRLLGKVMLQPDAKIPVAAPEAGTTRKKRAKATTVTQTDSNGRTTTTVTDQRLYGLVGPGVAQVPIYGIMARNVSAFDEACLGLVGYETISAALQQADQAPEVQEIILDVDSCGGECIGTYELADLIAGLSKPTYGFTEGIAASAACQQIVQCDEVYATCSALMGSIGVKAAILDDSASLAADGLKMEYFTAGANKLHNGADGYSLNDSDRALIQDRVDTYYAMFAASVQAGRGNAVVEPLVQKSAKIYVGQQAVDAGLCDAIVSGFDELVQLIVESRTA